MLKKELIDIKLSNKNVKFYRNLLNSDVHVGDVVKVYSDLISPGSSIPITGICDVCGGEKKISKKSYNKQTNYGKKIFSCSKKCSLYKTKKTNLEKWGVDNIFKSELIKSKIKKTNLEKWGVDNPQKSTEVKNKTKKTNLERWGFEVPSKSDFIKEKVKLTNNNLFGVNYPAMNSKILGKMKTTTYKRYGVDNFSKTEEFKKIIFKKSFDRMLNKLKQHGLLVSSNKSEYVIVCNICNSKFTILQTLMYNRLSNGEVLCTNCNKKKQTIAENKLYDFISSNYEKEIISNKRNIISKEIDIYLPDLKLAFEFNGLYWHSELYKEKNYHLNKTKECLDKEIQLIHVWEDDWNYKRNIVESIILNKLGKSNSIYARNTDIREITDNRIIRKFLNKNHLQGYVGSSIKLGLFYKDELVSLMTFGKLRKSLGQNSKENSYELLRFCNKLNYSVVGGASKLFHYFLRNYSPKEVISYSDNSRYDGDLYEKLGFKLKHNTPVNYYWVIDGIRNHRYNWRKDKLVKKGHDPLKTENEIMKELGHYRIFDSGNKKWIFNC